jgi:hypothetical protein
MAGILTDRTQKTEFLRHFHIRVRFRDQKMKKNLTKSYFARVVRALRSELLDITLELTLVVALQKTFTFIIAPIRQGMSGRGSEYNFHKCDGQTSVFTD